MNKKVIMKTNRSYQIFRATNGSDKDTMRVCRAIIVEYAHYRQTEKGERTLSVKSILKRCGDHAIPRNVALKALKSLQKEGKIQGEQIDGYRLTDSFVLAIRRQLESSLSGTQESPDYSPFPVGNGRTNPALPRENPDSGNHSLTDSTSITQYIDTTHSTDLTEGTEITESTEDTPITPLSEPSSPIRKSLPAGNFEIPVSTHMTPVSESMERSSIKGEKPLAGKKHQPTAPKEGAVEQLEQLDAISKDYGKLYWFELESFMRKHFKETSPNLSTEDIEWLVQNSGNEREFMKNVKIAFKPVWMRCFGNANGKRNSLNFSELTRKH